MEIFSFRKHAKREVGKLAPELFLFLKKLYKRKKTIGQQLSFYTFG